MQTSDWEFFVIEHINTLSPELWREDRLLTHTSTRGVNFKHTESELKRLKEQFDADYYLSKYPDVTEDAYNHFITKGIKENRNFRVINPNKCFNIINNCFDVNYYLKVNPDLKHLRHALPAIRHFLMFGMLEKRDYILNNFDRLFYTNTKIPPLPSSSYLLIELCPTRTSGLVNQMVALVNGIMLGIKTGRKIACLGFYPDYNRPYYVPLSKIFNISFINSLPSLCKTTIHDGSLLSNNWRELEYNMKTFNSFDNLTNKLLKETDQYLFINDAFTCNGMRFYSGKDRSKFKDIITSIRFNDKYYNAANEIRKSHGINQHDAVHFRLEDDIILLIGGDLNNKNLFEKLYRKYTDKIKLLTSEKIYISTGLMKYDNTYNYMLSRLKEEFPHVVFINREIDCLDVKGREIGAILDILICLDSESFIGTWHSTFSKLIKYHMQKSNQKWELLRF
ncbi:hypothetical protein BH23THE1_BH23THE1_34450 [soil metagenome]